MRYDYKCDSCGIIEINHSIKADLLTVCPKCGREIKRTFEGADCNFILMGTDWAGKNKKSVKDPSVSKDEKRERRKKAKKVLRDHHAIKNKKFW